MPATVNYSAGLGIAYLMGLHRQTIASFITKQPAIMSYSETHRNMYAVCSLPAWNAVCKQHWKQWVSIYHGVWLSATVSSVFDPVGICGLLCWHTEERNNKF